MVRNTENKKWASQVLPQAQEDSAQRRDTPLWVFPWRLENSTQVIVVLLCLSGLSVAEMLSLLLVVVVVVVVGMTVSAAVVAEQAVPSLPWLHFAKQESHLQHAENIMHISMF